MSTTPLTRAAQYAADFEAAQDSLIALVSSLTDDEWRRIGKNHPQRINDEDEGRTVAVIAHHVADAEGFIIERISRMLEGKPLAPVDFRASNATHASEHAQATREEVVTLLRANKQSIPPRVAAISDDQLDVMRDTPVGPMSVAQRLERVLIGHLKQHEGSIRAAIS